MFFPSDAAFLLELFLTTIESNFTRHVMTRGGMDGLKEQLWAEAMRHGGPSRGTTSHTV
jgi:hypothetical protein